MEGLKRQIEHLQALLDEKNKGILIQRPFHGIDLQLAAEAVVR